MTTEQIHASLDKMLANPKAKNFLNHLIRSYVPITNVVKVETKPTTKFECVLTKEKLFCIDDILTGLETEEYKANLMTYLKGMFDEKGDKTHPLSKMVGDKKLGVTGKQTDTFMSINTFQAFYDWVVTKTLKGDKHINWLLGSIKHKAFLERAEKINDADVQNKVAKMKKHEENKGRATYTLGDLDVLQKLKNELKNNE